MMMRFLSVKQRALAGTDFPGHAHRFAAHDPQVDAAHGLDLASWPSLEAQVAAIADDIAYDNHDIDDGLRAGLLTPEQFAENWNDTLHAYGVSTWRTATNAKAAAAAAIAFCTFIVARPPKVEGSRWVQASCIER